MKTFSEALVRRDRNDEEQSRSIKSFLRALAMPKRLQEP